jgi:hypothetical protein
MPVPNDFYNSHLAALHQWLLGHVVVQSYLTGSLRTCSPYSMAAAFTNRQRRTQVMTMPRLACTSR